jgi:glucose-6-phosphate isomerase
MAMALYETPKKIELVGINLFVNGAAHPHTTRTVREMRKTLRKYVEGLGNMDAYYMYRKIHQSGAMRFDITMIPPAPFGDELPKTHGHYHPGSEDGLAYPELYQVLRGSALFIMQKKNRNGTVDVMMVKANEGEVVLLPPGFGHVTVNMGEENLILSNLVYDRFEAMYDEYDENQGAAYYILKDGEIEQNGNYIIRNTERVSAKELNKRYGFSCTDILKEVDEAPERFTFLEKPKLLFKS